MLRKHKLLYVILPVTALAVSMAMVVKNQEKQSSQIFAQHDDTVTSLCFTPSGNALITSSRDQSVRIWTWPEGKLVRRLEHPDWVSSVSVAVDGKTLASTIASFNVLRDGTSTPGGDLSVRLWKFTSGEPLGKLLGHKHAISCASFLSATELATGSWDKSVRIWDVKTQTEKSQLNHSSPVSALSIARERREILTVTWDGTVTMWDAKKGVARRWSAKHQSSIAAASLSDRGIAITGASAVDLATHTAKPDRTLRIWDTKSGNEVGDFHRFALPVTAVCLSKDAKHLLTGGITPGVGESAQRIKNNIVILWDLQKQERMATLDANHNGVVCICFSPDERYALVGCFDGAVLMWDISKVLVPMSSNAATHPVIV